MSVEDKRSAEKEHSILRHLKGLGRHWETNGTVFHGGENENLLQSHGEAEHERKRVSLIFFDSVGVNTSMGEMMLETTLLR